MITLDQVKEALNIDFADQDAYLNILVEGAIKGAETLTGRNYTNEALDNFETMPDDIQKAIIQDVATNYENRDDFGGEASGTAVNASIYTYRRNSTNPMF